MMMLPVLEYQKEVCLRKYALMARYCGLADVHTEDRIAAERFLQAVKDLIATCGLDTLPLPVKASDYEELTRMIAKDSINYSAPMTFSNEDIARVLERVTEER